MRYAPYAFAVAGVIAVTPAASQECVDADPSAVLSEIGGDFELNVDPQDPAQNVIFVSNANNGRSRVVVARIDGLTGQVMPRSLATLAKNFYGLGLINGPEFIRKPTGELGILYPSPGGIRAVFRPAQPAVWNEFNRDSHGKSFAGDPPLVSPTSPGAYPAPPIPPGQSMFGQFRGDCTSICYAVLGQRDNTDVGAVLGSLGLVGTAVTQAPGDDYIYFSACRSGGQCALYTAQIDGDGGFTKGSIQRITDVPSPAPTRLAVTRHPVTETTVLFSNQGTSAVDVWEQQRSGMLRRIKRVSAPDNTHFRAEINTREIVLHYLVYSGVNKGSYTIPVAATGDLLQVGSRKKISDEGGKSVEMYWLPAAQKWATFFRNARGALRRCWVVP